MSPASHLVADLALSEFFGRAEHFGVDSWPPVLDMHGADRDVAHDDTDSHSYLGEVPPDVEEWVNSAIEVLAVPDEYLEIRKVSAGRVARACAARRSGRSILATRIAGRIRLEELIIDSVADLSAPIVGVIGEVRAAAFGAFSVPAGELVETLAQESVDAPSPRAALDALRSLGAQAVDAAIVAAFVECRCRTEIVAVAMADGRTARSAGGPGLRYRTRAHPRRARHSFGWTVMADLHARHRSPDRAGARPARRDPAGPDRPAVTDTPTEGPTIHQHIRRTP